MKWRNILLIFCREVLDQLRDRRTLFMVAVLPLLLYPVMGIGMVQMTVLFSEQPRTVVILGADNLPSLPLVSGSRFYRNWFRHAGDAEKLQVYTDASAQDSSVTKEEQAERKRLVERGVTLRKLLTARMAIEEQIAKKREAGQIEEALEMETNLRGQPDPLGNLFTESGIQVLMVIPEDFKTNLEQLRSELVKRGAEGAPPSTFNYPRPVIVQNSADERSVIAHSRVSHVMEEWERSLLKTYLRESGLPEDLPTPVKPTELDLAEQEQMSAGVWSKLFPALLIIMALTGAFYPAVDLCAGEKERGTMETLLICPATRTEIVLGKYLTVLLFSASTAILNLSSLGFTGKYMASLASSGGAASRLGDLSLPPLVSLVWIGIMLIPLSSLFSALCLALATFAKSSKEGQYYLTPLLMVTMGLTVFCLSPATEIEPFYTVMPVIGPALLLKGLLKATGPSTELYLYAVPVLITSIGYSLLALWWAIDQFGNEEVLFREAERFDIRLWVKHLLRDKEPTPSFAEAGFCFIMIMLLQFLSMKGFQSAIAKVTPEGRPLMMMQLLMIQQLALIATPALMMGVMLTTSLRQTFSLRWPGMLRMICALALPFALHPLTVELAISLQWFFPKLPPQMAETLALMSNHKAPLWLVLLTFAATPAICEEIAFRGFLLSGFRRSGKVALAVTFSALAFGLIHMIPQQVFNASLLGIVIGWMCVRSRSLLPGIAFHFVYNSLGVLHGRVGANVPTTGLWQYLFRHDLSPIANEVGTLRYQPALLCLCALATISLLHRLTSHPRISELDDMPPQTASGHGTEAPIAEANPPRLTTESAAKSY